VPHGGYSRAGGGGGVGGGGGAEDGRRRGAAAAAAKESADTVGADHGDDIGNSGAGADAGVAVRGRSGRSGVNLDPRAKRDAARFAGSRCRPAGAAPPLPPADSETEENDEDNDNVYTNTGW
jgi:hypothetical protein